MAVASADDPRFRASRNRAVGVRRAHRHQRPPEGGRLHGGQAAAVDAACGRRRGAAAGDDARRRPRRDRRLDRSAADRIAVARRGDVRRRRHHLRYRQPAVLVVAHVPHRGAVRIQSHDALAVARRSREGPGGGRGAGVAVADTDPVADAGRGAAVVVVGVGRVDGVPGADPRPLPDADRATVQQVHADGRKSRARTRGNAPRPLRVSQRGPLRDGRLEALRPRQRVLHGLRQGQAHRVLRYAARCASRPTRSKRSWRTNSVTTS